MYSLDDVCRGILCAIKCGNSLYRSAFARCFAIPLVSCFTPSSDKHQSLMQVGKYFYSLDDVCRGILRANTFLMAVLQRVVNRLMDLWEGYRESRRCSRDTSPESSITKYTGVRR